MLTVSFRHRTTNNSDADDELSPKSRASIRTQNNIEPKEMKKQNAPQDQPLCNWRQLVSENSSINISDLVENDTIEGRPNISRFFEPSEITGNSTECSIPIGAPERENAIGGALDDSMTVEQILAGSFSEEVRDMAVQLGEMKVRASYGGRTADMSQVASSLGADFDWGPGYKNVTSIPAMEVREGSEFSASRVIF